MPKLTLEPILASNEWVEGEICQWVKVAELDYYEYFLTKGSLYGSVSIWDDTGWHKRHLTVDVERFSSSFK
jgi:hypothetical protein